MGILTFQSQAILNRRKIVCLQESKKLNGWEPTSERMEDFMPCKSKKLKESPGKTLQTKPAHSPLPY